MRGQKMTLQPDKHNWGFHPQTPKVYRFWVSGKGDTTSSDVIYATENIGRQLWPGLAGNYGPAGRGKRLYALFEEPPQFEITDHRPAPPVWIIQSLYHRKRL